MIREEISACLDALVFALPGRSGGLLRAHYLRSKLAALGPSATISQGVHVLGARAIKVGRDFSCARKCSLYADGAGLALRQTDHGRGSGRDAARGGVPAVRRGTNQRPGHRVPERQRAGIYLASVPAICEGHGIAPLPHTPAEPGVERLGQGVLRQRQAGLCVSGLLGNLRDGGTADPRVDRALQPARPAQCTWDAVTRGVLCGLESQKHATTCPKLGGAVQEKTRTMLAFLNGIVTKLGTVLS